MRSITARMTRDGTLVLALGVWVAAVAVRADMLAESDDSTGEALVGAVAAADQPEANDAEKSVQGEPVSTQISDPEHAHIYIWCSAEIYTPGVSGPAPYMSLEIPADPNYGVPYWNIGRIPIGGVADSWYDGGPGKFRIKNTGNVPAYVHIFAASESEMMSHDGWTAWMMPTDKTPPMLPSGWDPEWGGHHLPWYALAVAVNVLDVAPRWNVLNQFYYSFDHDSPYPEPPPMNVSPTFGRVLGRAQPGEIMVFDLKFWAPQNGSEWMDGLNETDPIGKLVRFEAATFPRWPEQTWVR
jgi:hypothetical protein